MSNIPIVVQQRNLQETELQKQEEKRAAVARNVVITQQAQIKRMSSGRQVQGIGTGKVSPVVPSGIAGAKSVKLDNGESVSASFYNSLTPELQEELRKVGIAQYNTNRQAEYDRKMADINAKFVKLDYIDKDGNPQYVDRKLFEGLTPDQQKRLMGSGVEEFNKTEALNITQASVEIPTILITEHNKNLSDIEARAQKDYAALSIEGKQGGEAKAIEAQKQDAIKSENDRYQEALSMLSGSLPKAVAIKSGTGKYSDYKGTYYVRTAQGDMPAWMLIPDYSYANYLNLGQNQPAMMAQPRSMVGVMFPYGKRWDFDRYTAEEAKLINDNLLWTLQPEIFKGPVHVGDVKLSGPNKMPTLIQSDENWDEASYLKHIGMTVDDLKNQSFSDLPPEMMQQLFDMSRMPYIDPNTEETKYASGFIPYGMYDSSGKKLNDVAYASTYAAGAGRYPMGVATAGGMSGGPARTKGYLAPIPQEYIASAPEEVIRKQIAVGELIRTKDNQLIPKDIFNQFTKEQQYKIKTEGGKGLVTTTDRGEVLKIDSLGNYKTPEGYDLVSALQNKFPVETLNKIFDPRVVAQSKVRADALIAFNPYKTANGYNLDYAIYKDKSLVNPARKLFGEQTAWEAYYRVPDEIFNSKGEALSKKFYDGMNEGLQKTFMVNGGDVFQKAFNMEYVRIPDSGNYMSRTDLAKLPPAQQAVLKEKGEAELTKFIAKNQAILDKYTTITANIQTSDVNGVPVVTKEAGYNIEINLVSALRKDPKMQYKEGQAVKNLYSEEQIKAATNGRIIDPVNLVEMLQVGEEEMSSPTAIQYLAKSMLVASKLASQKLINMQPDVVQAGIAPDKVIPKIEAALPQNTKDELLYHAKGMSEFSDTIILPAAQWEQQLINDWQKDSTGAMRIYKGASGAALSMVSVVPLMIVGSLYSMASKSAVAALSKDQKEKTKEAILAATAGGLLATGMAGWFIGRPAAIVKDPLLEVPSTAVYLFGAEKAARMLEDGVAKLSPAQTSLSAMGINPMDVARVPVRFPGEAREILEIIEKNNTIVNGENIASEIFGKTKDQVAVTTDGGIGVKGYQIVSGLQRAVPNLIHHASGGEFKAALFESVNKKGKFTVEKQYYEKGGGGKGTLEFVSPQLSGSFLKPDPVIMNGIYSPKDFRALPDWATEGLRNEDMAHIRDKIYEWANEGKLKQGIYPVMKWYGPNNTLEYEMIVTPGFEWYKTPTIPWFAKMKGLDTSVTYTTSPISGEFEGGVIKAGEKVPMVWLLSKNALAEGRDMPTLKDLYKAEVYSAITGMRKLASGFKMRDITLEEKSPATSSMLQSRLQAIRFEEPKWTNDPKQIIKRVNSGQISPYYRQRATVIAVDRNGRILTVQERNGHWALPGGKIEGGASSLSTIIRELREETGVKPVRARRVGVIKDAEPMIADNGKPMWKAGKPVYNQHHVYIVEINTAPRARGEVRGVRQVAYNKSPSKNIIDHVGKQAIDDFVSRKAKSLAGTLPKEEIYKAEKESTITPRETKRTSVKEEEAKALPYRLDIKPSLPAPTLSELRPNEVEPDIFTSYSDSIKYTEPQLKEPRLMEPLPKETIPIEKMPGEKVTKETTPKETTPQEKAPTEKATKETTPAERLTEVVPAEQKPTEKAPTEKVPTDKVPTENIPTEKIPITPVPDIPVTTIKLPNGKELRLSTAQREGMIMWKQGIEYVMIWPDDLGNYPTDLKRENKNVYWSRTPIEGVEVHDGIGSAAKSIVKRFGEIPKQLSLVMGFQDIVVGRGGKKPTLDFELGKSTKKGKRQGNGHKKHRTLSTTRSQGNKITAVRTSV